MHSFYIRKMWLYGGTCGLLWSIGNVFSIIAVDYLGEGVGYSATQSAMLGTCMVDLGGRVVSFVVLALTACLV